MYLLQYLGMFLCTLLEESEIGAGRSSMKKVFLKTSQNSQENICAWASFVIKLQAGGLQLDEMDTLVRVFSFEFC